MALVAKEIGLDGLHEPLLMPTSMIAEAGQITVVEGEIGPGSTTFALALAGRVKLSRGEVSWDENTAPALRRRKVALVTCRMSPNPTVACTYAPSSDTSWLWPVSLP